MPINRTTEFKREISKRGRPPTPPQSVREDFTKASSSLCADLSKMNLFFTKTYSKYINAIVYNDRYTSYTEEVSLGGGSKTLTATEKEFITAKGREEFDDTMIAFLKQCKQRLKEMERIATRDPSQNKVHSYHRQRVAEDLESRLAHLAKSYERMIKYAASETMRTSITLDMGTQASDGSTLRKRKTRRRWPTVQSARNVETSGTKKAKKNDVNYDNKEEMNNDEILNNGEYENLGETKEENYRHSGMPSQQNQRSETKNSNGPNSIAANNSSSSSTSFNNSSDLSNDFLKQESMMLERNLKTKFDATKEIETQFIELANMTKIFTTHVEDQHDQVQMIADDTNDALDSANSGLNELNKAKTGTSKYFLSFVFIVLSFIILFLDWWSW